MIKFDCSQFYTILICIILISGLQSIDYDKSSLYKITTNTKSQLDHLNLIISEHNGHIDVWTDLNNRAKQIINIAVESAYRYDFENDLTINSIDFQLTIDNIEQLISKQMSDIESRIQMEQRKKKLGLKQSKTSSQDDFDYGKYHTLDEINKWMDDIEQAYSSYVKVFDVSRSYENRTIRAFKISVPPKTDSPNTLGTTKKAIWFDGGIHSREWISPATVIYMTNELISKYGIDNDTTLLLDTFDFYSLPVFNVDGYLFSFVNKTTRLWRKTRSINENSACIGTDPNRNWNSHFCEQGASKDPCSDAYCGSKAFSEIELKLVADFLRENKDNIVGYLNIHAYSQLWMSPYGYSHSKPKHFNILNEGGRLATEAIEKVYGTKYEYGSIADIIYVASGSSADYTFDELGIFFSYGLELRDNGTYGFLLPEDQILPTARETWEGFKALAFYIKSDPLGNGSSILFHSTYLILLSIGQMFVLIIFYMSIN